MAKSGPPRRSSRPPPAGANVVKDAAAILRADLDSQELILDDLEDVTAVEMAIIQEDIGVDEEWDPDAVTQVMPEHKVLQLREKCR